MTIVRLKWAHNGATDIHLMPTLSSPELNRLLLVDDLTGDTLTEDIPVKSVSGLALTYTAQLKGPLANHGVAVDTVTGKVTVSNLALRGHSFILNIAATKDGVTVRTRIRIHVHEKISNLWLTPSRLTVRERAGGVRFSVLALFDQVLDGMVVVAEGVICDISNWSPFEEPADATDLTYVHRSGTNTGALTWSKVSGPIGVHDETGVLTAPLGTAPLTDVKVTTFNGETATAKAACAPPWTTTVKLKCLGGPGAAKAGAVRNILFLPDGFQAAERSAYNRLVGVIVDRLRGRGRTRPFADLTSRINYWRGWLPSPDAGITALTELDALPLEPGQILPTKGNGIPLPSVTRPAADWSLADVINAIGLPNQADYPTGTTVDSKINFFRNLYGDTITADLLRPRFNQWLDLNDRMLLNERDTAFHMAFGERPSIDPTTDQRFVATNPRRLTNEDFNTFLNALRGENDEELPAGLWTTGRDRNLVVMICRSSRLGGLARRRRVSATVSGSTVSSSLGHRLFHQILLNPDGDGFDLKPDNIPANLFYPVWLTAAHELGHAFGLGDEYGGTTTAPTPSKIRAVGFTPNVQDRASLTVDGTPNAAIDVSKIKWSEWPRIDKAGVLRNGLSAPVGGRFTVDLVDVNASRLKRDDIVKFRRRPLATAGPPSDICKVLAVDTNTNQVIVEPLFGGTVDPARFPAGSILLSYVRKPDPNFPNTLGGLLTLTDETVLQRITDTQNPLNAEPLAGEAPPPNDVEARPCANVQLRVPTAAKNFLDRKAPKPPRFSSWTIGLYENGSEHNCGIFRPTGTCLMRRQFDVDPKTKTLNMYDLCLVCRYAFIDLVDPTLHGVVERDFIVRYGKRGAR